MKCCSVLGDFLSTSAHTMMAIKTGQTVTQLEVRAANQGVCPIHLTPKGYRPTSFHWPLKWAFPGQAAAFWKGTEEDNVITNPSCRLEGISDDEG